MEEFDDLLKEPDESGYLDLSHRAWSTLDDVLWTWGQQLIVLNVSFNNIKKISSGIGELVLLREFDISNNSLEDLPLEMGEVVYHRDGTIGVYVKDPFGNYLEYIWYSDDQKEVFLND